MPALPLARTHIEKLEINLTMNHTMERPDVGGFIKTHLVDVFSTMLQMTAVLSPQIDIPKMKERISGSVGFGGEKVNGAVYLHLSNGFAVRAAAAMLAFPPEEIPGDADVNDVVGEVSNMLTGGLKSYLCDAGALCAISTPGIIRGVSFEIEPMPDVQRTVLVFQCDDEPVVVEIHIKFLKS
jgi:chemotaxis protein CheX